MTEFEDTYQRLILIDHPLRRRWLLDHQPAWASPAHWWLALIEAAISDLRQQKWVEPTARPRADVALAAALIDWALEQGFPLALGISQLTQLTRLALDAGQQITDLPANAQPDAITRRALNGFAMSPQHAITRAATLRATPLSVDDFIQPGEGLAAWQALTLTADYRDYHQLLNIDRMLTDVAPLLDLVTDADLATDLRTWLKAQGDLNPAPTTVTHTPTNPNPTD